MNWILEWWENHQTAKKLHEEAMKDFLIIVTMWEEMEKNRIKKALKEYEKCN